MTTPLTILLSPSTVRLSAELDPTRQLVLKYNATSLASHEDGLQIAYDPEQPTWPVRVEIGYFSEGGIPWKLNATHGSFTWHRDASSCSFEWNEPTNGELRVDVTASNGTETRTRPIFIKVQPQIIKPDPT